MNQRRIKLEFNVVYHPLRKKIDTDSNGFVLLDAVYHLSFNHLNQTGWCFASKPTLAEIVGVSRPTIFRYIEKFVEQGWLVRQDGTGYLRTSDRFNALLEEHRGRVQINQSFQELKTPPSQNETTRLNPPSQNEQTPSQNEMPQSQNDTTDRLKMRPNKYSNKNTYKNNKNKKDDDEKPEKTNDPDGSCLSVNEFDNSLIEQDFQLVESETKKKSDSYYREHAIRFYKNVDETKGINWGYRAFEKLWRVYGAQGKRGSREKAWVAFHLLTRIESESDFEKQKPLLASILTHVEQMGRTRQWRDGFIPHFVTYINQKRWEDGVPDERKLGDPIDFSKNPDKAKSSRDRFEELKARSEGKK